MEQFQGKPGLDDEIKEKFLTLYERAANREVDYWRNDAKSCLALLILLDQFPRNMFRGTARAFESDEYAVEIANFALEQNVIQKFSGNEASFVLMPFQHSEKLEEFEKGMEIAEAPEAPEEVKMGLPWWKKHHEILKRFGRYPHRNKILGRENTEEEKKYLKGELSDFEKSQMKTSN